MKKPELSIIIVNYNSFGVLKDCLSSLEKVSNEAAFEAILVENGSTDESGKKIRSLRCKSYELKTIQNGKNVGFGAANNQARSLAQGKYILFLNPDTIVHKNTLRNTLQYIKAHEDVGAVTCKMVLPDGKLDRDARRSFPTPWVALTHFLFLDRIFPSSKLFSRYWYGYKSAEKDQEVDVAQAAFAMLPRGVLDGVGWFDEDYFLDGEDIDLSYRLNLAGYKIIYLAGVSITHVKKVSKKHAGKKSTESIRAGTMGMRLFYKKHLGKKYPFFVNLAIYSSISLLTYLRVIMNLFK